MRLVQGAGRLVAAAAVGVLAANATQAQAPAAFGSYAPVATFPGSVGQSFYLPMPDGTRLAMKIERPANSAGRAAPGRFPVIWHHTLSISQRPEDGAGPRAGGFATLPSLALHGYVVVQVARRGNGQSFGARRGNHIVAETRDAYTVTEWLARQSWSTGAVGIYGCSNTGDAAMQAAGARPPHLKAVFAGCFAWDKYDSMHRGGILAQWGTGPQRTIAQDMAIESVDGDPDRALLRAAATEHQQSTHLLELLKGVPLRDSVSPLVGGQYWPAVAVARNLEALRRPGLALYFVGGWYDEFRDQALIAHLNLPGSHVLIGPWKHCDNAGFALAEEAHRFFDRYLKGDMSAFAHESPIRYFEVNGDGGRWRATDRWPVAGASAAVLALGARDTLGGVPQAGVRRLIDTAPTTCAEQDSGSRAQPCHVAGAGLVYTGAPLDEDRVVTGDPILDLRITANAADAHIFAYLEAVAPDGGVRALTEGRLRAALGVGNPAPFRVPGTPWHRAHASDVRPLQPAEVRHVRFAMLPVSAVIPAGYRLRLVIRTTDYRERAHADTPVELTVVSGGQRGSTLTVPFVKQQDSTL